MKVYNYKGPKLKHFLSEALNTPFIKKHKLLDASIIILLGGKGVGKSYIGFEMFKNIFEKNENAKVGYIRNSIEEIKGMKLQIAEMLKTWFPLWNIRTSDQGICKDNNFQIIKFLSSKSYNNISGNTLPFDCLFYDEAFQQITTSSIKLVNNLLPTFNTLFRTKPWKVICCGNTSSASNNPIFNLFKIKLPELPDGVNMQLTDIDNGYIKILRYTNDLFENAGNADSKDIAMIKKYNKKLYDSLFTGKEWMTCEELIDNDMQIDTTYKLEKYMFNVNDKWYQVFSKNDIWYIKEYEKNINQQQAWIMQEAGIQMFSDDNLTINRFVLRHVLIDSTFLKNIYKRILKNKVMFCDYNSYLYCMEYIPDDDGFWEV